MPSDLSRLAALENGGRDRSVDDGRTRPERSPEPADGPSNRPSMRPGGPVPDGPVAHRRSVRRWGVPATLVAPLVAGALGALLLWGSDTGWRGIPGFGLVVAAAPVLPIAGVPAGGGQTRYAAAIAASAVLWLIIGVVATRRATRSPVATWSDWVDEYRRLAIGAAAGGLAALCLSWFMVDLGLA